ncbi:hypothetical protein MJ1_0175 [Nanobdella aerobiophila]|uniref:Uncharacterized protein n=1 Tax=Nanobdella aerobiophila TaxID=2586965 RepID=A0A915WRA4_9ARCH|nr:hypothetical protein [Nanobdella aerobiophila]BBL45348.1 hypothetical protein MJ1_0175 [Nanobdella aerobiophila]
MVSFFNKKRDATSLKIKEEYKKIENSIKRIDEIYEQINKEMKKDNSKREPAIIVKLIMKDKKLEEEDLKILREYFELLRRIDDPRLKQDVEIFDKYLNESLYILQDFVQRAKSGNIDIRNNKDLRGIHERLNLINTTLKRHKDHLKELKII